MSLRAFHIVFVAACTILFTFLAVWVFGFAAERSGIITLLGVLGGLGAIGMPIYGVYFYKKVKNILL